MDKHARILITGHRRMVGSAIVRRLKAGSYDNLLLRTHAELDLLDQRTVHDFLAEQQPDYVFIAAAKVGGIQANNQYRADYLCESYQRQYGRQYISVMPTNLYGPNDNYDLANSHVLPALLRKAHEAKQRGDTEYKVWGSGTPRKLLDVSRLSALGWRAGTGLREGIRPAYDSAPFGAKPPMDAGRFST